MVRSNGAAAGDWAASGSSPWACAVLATNPSAPNSKTSTNIQSRQRINPRVINVLPHPMIWKRPRRTGATEPRQRDAVLHSPGRCGGLRASTAEVIPLERPFRQRIGTNSIRFSRTDQPCGRRAGPSPTDIQSDVSARSPEPVGARRMGRARAMPIKPHPAPSRRMGKARVMCPPATRDGARARPSSKLRRTPCRKPSSRFRLGA